MDLNSDGYDDLLLSGYCGTVHIFYGKGKGKLSKGEFLKDESGTPVNSGRYQLSIKTKCFYTVEKSKAVHSKSVVTVDWDNDGDYDLVMNTSYGIRLCINKGDKMNPKFSSKTTLLSLHPSHFAYSFVDWDDDGLWDIICGGENGGVYYYKNMGKPGKPEFAESKCIYTDEDIEANPYSISSCQISVTDYNNDGKKDILLGCRCSCYEWKGNLIQTQKAKMRKDIILSKLYMNKMKVRYNQIYHSSTGDYSAFKNVLNKDKEYLNYSEKCTKYLGESEQSIKIINHSNVYLILGK